MRRRRKKRSPLSVSLFPFLAVLICTLGVLIVMLVMAVKAADEQAAEIQSSDDQEKLATISNLEEALEFNRLQIDGIKLVRPDAVARLSQSRTNRSYLQDEIRKLKMEFERVGRELRELASLPEVAMIDPVEFSQQAAIAELSKLEQELEATNLELDTKRESATQSGPANYVIVPHKGAGGTFRRPIFIECTKNAMTLQPAGIRLDQDDFLPPLEPGNMLDSALLAIREYWQRYDLAGKDGSPYPLIVVRPDGAETFVLARMAMKSWDDEFGYELVESDKTLDFGKRDPQLESEINDAIKEARRRQKYRVAHALATRSEAPRFGSNSRPGLTASGRRGGFVSNAAGFGAGHDDGLGRERPAIAQTSNQENEAHEGKSDANSESQSDPAAQTSTQGGNAGGDSSHRNPYEEQSLATQRGANWALPSQTPGATGYVRPIRIICEGSVLEVHSAVGQPKRIAMNGETSDVIDQLVEEIWKQIDSWGVSGVNGYWKPQLRITVAPDGQQRFAELKGLLFRSGLTLQESN